MYLNTHDTEELFALKVLEHSPDTQKPVAPQEARMYFDANVFFKVIDGTNWEVLLNSSTLLVESEEYARVTGTCVLAM